VWDEQLRVPLVMRFPKAAGVAPGRASQLVSLIDMMPTALGRVQSFDTPKWREFFKLATGVDALAADFEERPVFAQRTGRELAEDPGEMYAITTPRWKFIHEPEVGDKLFDRSADPHELQDLAAKDAQQSAAQRRQMQLMMDLQKRRGAELGPAEAGEMDPELLRQMQALGYLGGEDGRNGDAPTPKVPQEEPVPDEDEAPKEQGDKP
jgi:arylsulfatase A-like enzyme